MSTNIIAITPGDPAGIGLDLVIQVAQKAHDFSLVAIADPDALKARAKLLGLEVTLREFNQSTSKAKELQIIPVKCPEVAVPGVLNANNARYVLNTLDVAIEGCLKQRFDALVTGPIQKSIINDAGIAFTGHTEYLAAKTSAKLPVMMLANEKLRVALVTTHLPLKQVANALNAETVKTVIEITYHEMSRKFGIHKPKLAICGLNPHAGENGHLGHEEIEFITPVINQLKQAGLDLLGPLPADTAFTAKILEQTDAVIAMYHDQGLPVVKALGFGETVNITLGLPIIRTSVDHGTALDLAGTGNISQSSLLAALAMANHMAAQQKT